MKNKENSPPQIRNPEKTKANILKKATALFAKSGFEGTSINDIIQASEINKRMVYHYFGDKRGLYREIYLKEWGSLKIKLDQALADFLDGQQAENFRFQTAQ